MHRRLVLPLLALALAGCPERKEEPEDLRSKAGRLYKQMQDANERAAEQAKARLEAAEQ
jgi:hypothetical protein